MNLLKLGAILIIPFLAECSQPLKWISRHIRQQKFIEKYKTREVTSPSLSFPYGGLQHFRTSCGTMWQGKQAVVRLISDTKTQQGTRMITNGSKAEKPQVDQVANVRTFGYMSAEPLRSSRAWPKPKAKHWADNSLNRFPSEEWHVWAAVRGQSCNTCKVHQPAICQRTWVPTTAKTWWRKHQRRLATWVYSHCSWQAYLTCLSLCCFSLSAIASYACICCSNTFWMEGTGHVYMRC